MTDDARMYSPASARNRDAIYAVLGHHLPSHGLVLEIASGSGEHTAHFAQYGAPDLIFQPSDPDANARASIDAWSATSGLSNIRPALALDAEAQNWPITNAQAVLCINMIHISPWSAAIGLTRGAGRILQANGVLYLYGPFRREGRHTALSNEAFDQDLKRRNPAWGVRDVEAVAALAMQNGFTPPTIIEMPANNLSLIFTRSR